MSDHNSEKNLIFVLVWVNLYSFFSWVKLLKKEKKKRREKRKEKKSIGNAFPFNFLNSSQTPFVFFFDSLCTYADTTFFFLFNFLSLKLHFPLSLFSLTHNSSIFFYIPAPVTAPLAAPPFSGHWKRAGRVLFSSWKIQNHYDYCLT